MDIHRCRFVPYPASAINAFAFSHPSSLQISRGHPPTLRLAVGRENGDIEIWNPNNGNWTQEIILRSGKDRSIEGLAWTQDQEEDGVNNGNGAGKLRLFSTGYSNVITEWNLATGCPMRHSSGNYGDIWCLSAQPRFTTAGFTSSEPKEKPQNQMLAAGCADGTVALHSTADGGLSFTRALPRPTGKRSRALSLTFQSRDIVVVGYSDSAIRILDVRGRGRLISSMSLGGSSKAGTLVWSVNCLADGTIVSGDSTGEIKIWDPKTLSLFQRIESHRADILAIAVSVDGTSILSSGMDRRSILYRRSRKNNGRWQFSSHRRLHASDVKAMAAYETRETSIVASGGLDAKPIIIPFKNFHSENSLSLPSFPSIAPVDSAPTARLFMSWWNRTVFIWRLSKTNHAHENDLAPSRLHHLAAKLLIKGEENITSASISRDGRTLLTSTNSRCTLFSLKPRKSFKNTLKVTKIETPGSFAAPGARIVLISPDSRWVAVVPTDNHIYLHRLVHGPGVKDSVRMLAPAIELSRRIRQYPQAKRQHGSLGDYTKLIIRLAWSSDSKILACGDLEGYLDAWTLEGDAEAGNEDDAANDQTSVSSSHSDKPSAGGIEESGSSRNPTVLGEYWAHVLTNMPRLSTMPLVLSFRPTNGNSGDDRLLVITAMHQVLEFHARTGSLSEWSRRNQPGDFPAEFLKVRDRTMGCIWDLGARGERVWIFGSTWLWMFDLSRDLPENSGQSAELQKSGVANAQLASDSRKRKRHEENGEGAGGRRTNHQPWAGNQRVEREQEVGRIDNDLAKNPKSAGKASGTAAAAAAATDESRSGDVESEEQEEQEDPEEPLVRLRRLGDGERSAASSRPGSWRTYKYRPILGMVLVGDVAAGASSFPTSATAARAGHGHAKGDEKKGKDEGQIEVALVERPLWEADLAPRWEDGQERDIF